MFNIAEMENKRGKKLGMEVGTTRERILVALCMYAYGSNSVEFPPTTSPELDVIVCGQNLSIKTKSGKGCSGVKLLWASDWIRMNRFVEDFKPNSDLLYVNIVWNSNGGVFLIPKKAQRDVLDSLGSKFFKLPKRGTNPHGVEFSKDAMRCMQEHQSVLSISVRWKRDESLLGERASYERWIELWDTLA